MSILTEKRNEFNQKLIVLTQNRAANIESKVALYRASLEAEAFPEADQIKKVIAALDEVIAFDQTNSAPAATIAATTLITAADLAINPENIEAPVANTNICDRAAEIDSPFVVSRS